MTGHDMLSDFSSAFWPALAGHLWQATLVAGICLLALPAFRNAGARARHLLWVLAFVRFVIPQDLVSFAIGQLGLHPGWDIGLGTRVQQLSDTLVHVAQPLMPTDAQPEAVSPATAGHPEIYCILTILWISGCALLLSRWWFRQREFERSLRISSPEAGSEFMRLLESLKTRLGIRRRAKLRIAWQGSEPGVYGVWRPVLVLPAEMPRQLSPGEVKAVLAHELVHIARWDNLWNNLQMLVCCIFWFYPVVWLLDRRLTTERERSCDEWVVWVLGNSQAYASGLIKMTSLGLGLRVAGVTPMAGANLKKRIENIMSKKTNAKSGLAVRILLPSVAVLTIFMYLMGAQIPERGARTAPFNLTIENSENAPLKILSASVDDISISPRPTAQVAAQLVHPKIVVQNNSNRVASVYVLEFRKAGASRLYFSRPSISLAPKATDTVERNEFLWSSGEKAADAGKTWSVRLVSAAFKDGSHQTLHPAPIPPPPGVWETQTQPSGVKPIQVAGKFPESKLIRRVEPIYPELAKTARVQGLVVLAISVDEEGNVIDATVTKGHPLLNDAAVEAVMQWKYSPTLLNGKPVPVMATVSLVFNLK